MADAAPAARDDRDVMRLAPTVDEGMLQALADRLETRSTDAGYLRLSTSYFDQLPLATARDILALGCGTGVEARALKRREVVAANIVGIDHSSFFIGIAAQHAVAEGLDDGLTFRVGDAHRLEFSDASFDIVTLHTLISHVDDPLGVLREVRRVLRPGGTVAIFDGDYASVTYAHPDEEVASAIREALLMLLFANPRIMRDLPRLLREADLDLTSANGEVFADIGRAGHFWTTAVEGHAGYLTRSGLLPQATIDTWRDYQRRAIQGNTFFATTNYYTYLATRL